MNIRILAGLVLTTSVCADGMGSSPFGSGGKARLTFNVVNDVGIPVSNATVSGYFESPLAADYAGDIFQLRTDKRGMTIAKGRVFSFIEGSVKCDGHYRTEYKIYYPAKLTTLKTPPTWSDWVATNTVVLKRMRNPVPMYVKMASITLPTEYGSVGYDMFMGDWVAPLGRGVATDMVFTVDAKYQSFTKWGIVLDVQLPGVSNGLISSITSLTPYNQPVCELRSIHEAPRDGYVQQWQYKVSRTGNVVSNPSATDLGRLFYYRIRSETDEQGRLVRALYGKIYGHIFADFDEYQPNRRRNVIIQFTYYLNPDGTRNVEFNPERNLFPTGKRDGKFAP